MGNKTVVIFGSSRSNGNTRKILDELLSIKKEIDIIDLNECENFPFVECWVNT